MPGSAATSTVLVVEDDELVRDTAQAVLRRAGYQTLCVENGDIALILLAQSLPISILFTDIVMSGEIDGIRLAQKARELRPDIKVLYTTGFANALKVDPAVLHGTLLPKPYRAEALVAEIASLAQAS